MRAASPPASGIDANSATFTRIGSPFCVIGFGNGSMSCASATRTIKLFDRAAHTVNNAAVSSRTTVFFMRRSVDGGSPPVNYFAFSRTSGRYPRLPPPHRVDVEADLQVRLPVIPPSTPLRI